MHPLTSDLLQNSQKLLSEKPILLLDTATLSIHYLIYLVLARSIPQNLGGSLPLEIWFEILEHYSVSLKPYSEAVRPDSISRDGDVLLLRCRKMALHIDFFDYLPCEIGHEKAIRKMLQRPEVEDWLDGHNDTTTTFIVPFSSIATTTLCPGLRLPNCLFTAVTIPDVIAFIQDGNCEFCEGERTFWPDSKSQLFDVHLVEGSVLPCPLCMGVDSMAEVNAYWRKCLYDDPPEEASRARHTMVIKRLTELGYLSRDSLWEDLAAF